MYKENECYGNRRGWFRRFGWGEWRFGDGGEFGGGKKRVVDGVLVGEVE